jgi:hypothetical protein
MDPLILTLPSNRIISPQIAASKLVYRIYSGMMTKELLDRQTFPEPTGPQTPRSSPLWRVMSIPSSVGCRAPFDHANSPP